jgi:hypothetical protein
MGVEVVSPVMGTLTEKVLLLTEFEFATWESAAVSPRARSGEGEGERESFYGFL